MSHTHLISVLEFSLPFRFKCGQENMIVFFSYFAKSLFPLTLLLFWYCVPAAIQLQDPLLWGDETEFVTGSLLAIA